MADGETWLRCTREDILATEQAFYADRQWRGQLMLGFNRWMGLDDRLHAVVVLADRTRLFLDEDVTARRARRKGAAWNFPYRWY